jgi:hypothetical protein
MKNAIRLLLVPALGLLAVSPALAQAPVNDNFVDAITLTGPIVTTMGSNVGATKPFGGPGGGEPIIPGPFPGSFGGASVWWNWTATASGETTIDTEGSDFNTLLGIYTGEAANRLTLVAANDNFEANTWSRVVFNAVAGTTYRIMVDGFRSGPGFGAPAMGNIKLNIKGVGGIDYISPTPGAVFTVGDPVPVAVTITPEFPNPPASSVEFYANGNLFATLAAPPYSAMASNLPPGSNTVYVVAIDSTGAPIKSSEVKILVQNIGVTILTPFEDTMYLSTNPILITAWTYLPAGSISLVEYLVDGAKVAESTTAPHVGVWSNPVGGSHRLTAVGRTEAGTRYISQAVNIGVAATLVSTGAVWKYLDNGSDQGTAWFAADFDDSSWASGPAELGYGDGDEATVVASGPEGGFFITTYFRKAVEIPDLAGLASITITLERDDAAVLYLNGHEVFRSSNLPAAPEPIGFDTVATGQAVEDTIDIFQINPTNFVVGINTFAVEIHQQAPNSSDISFNFALRGIPIIIHNLSPNVDLISPTNTQYFIAPPSITFEATASDDDGSVVLVEFFADGVKIGEDAEAPYSAVWNNPPVAAHKLTAVATDDQGATTTSDEALVVVYDAAGTPVAAVTSPVDHFVTQGPTNWLVTATAYAIAGVTNVEFYNNGQLIGTDSTSPYSVLWSAPFGTNTLTAVAVDAGGVRGTSPPITAIITIPPTNVIAPVVATQIPAGGSTVSNLTSITVVFSEYVQGIDASDLLINGQPATGVNASHSRSNYTFTFAQPPYGSVTIAWAADHGIRDYGWPAELPFDHNSAGATWTYNLIDKTPPTIATRTPTPNAILTNLTQVTVTFSEPVTGVDATDLLLNGTPALGVTGSGIHYTFAVPTPGSSGTSVVNVTWAATNGIMDVALEPNAFNSTSTNATWRFIYDPRVVLVQSNSQWRFVKGLAEASQPVSAWRQLSYDASGWSNAPAPFFFGDPYTNATTSGTLLSDMASNYTTIFLRQEFYVQNRGEILNLLLNHQTDDGLIAWLNGVEVLRYNVPNGANGDLPYTATAVNAANEPGNAGAAFIVATLTNAAVSRLLNGTNVLAVQVFNQSLTNSSDFGFNAQLYYFPIDPATVPPRVVSADPPGGDIYSLNAVTFSFSEGVTNVEAADLLINGIPATSVTSTTNSIYTFHFPQPPYGPVAITWDTNHAVLDFDNPPRVFDGTAASARVNFFLLDPSTPHIVTRAPAPNTILTGLTSITISFDEVVAGVDASDFLVSGTPATSVFSPDSKTFTFGFVQPPFGSVTIRWATNHAITDLSVPPAPFYPTRFGHQWDYTLIDPVPSVTLTSPTNNTYFLPPANITLRATATDNDGTVAQVEFYEGTTMLSQQTAAPYAFAVSNLLVGTYTFRALATDNQGLIGTSAPVVINVVTSLPIALVRGPYLQMGSPTGGVVRWRTDAISDGLVYYGTDPNNLSNYAAELSVTNEHIVTLGDLQPDTKYYYSIGSAAYRLVGGEVEGANYWFKTSPPVGTRRPVRFWALGDAGTAGNGDPERQQSTRDAFYTYAANTREPDIWLMLGDNAYNSGTDAEYQRAVFNLYPNTLRNYFLWPTLGNHETDQSTTATDFPYLHIFSLPKSGQAGGVPSGTEKYYSFDYANIHFICLDSMTSGQNATSAMADWLRSDLEATASEWVIVFFHHPPYTKGSHDSDREQDLVQIRQNLMPILEGNGVDLVLSGHSHCYERSFLLNGHYGMSGTITESMKLNPGDGRPENDGAYQKNESGEGTVYTVAGSAGQATGGSLDHPAHFISLNELGTLVVDVNENRLEGLFLHADGSIRDTFTITKPDPHPAAPLHLLAVAASDTAINLSWTAGSSNHFSYSVERSVDGINFTEVMSASPDTTAVVDSSLLPDTTYIYRVRAMNSIGPGKYSNLASASTVLPDSVPRSPAGLVAHADNGIEFFRSQMVLRWQDRSTNESSFQIEHSLDGTTFEPVASVAANINTYVDRNLASSTLHYYRVRAVNALGASAPSVIDGDETHPQSQLARVGDTVSFHAGSEGVAPMRYQWRYMDAPLAGETNETLTLTSVNLPDEGDYSVVVYDATGRIQSNPAYLFVVGAPQILIQPDDRVAFVGSSSAMSVSAIGTAPTTYQWYRNGAVIPGATQPLLAFQTIQLADEGGYHAIVANEFGYASSRTAALIVYQRPVFAPIADIITEVLTPISFTVGVTDPNSPKLPLKFSLGASAPTNATIDATTGLFQWTPNRSQAPGYHPITIFLRDDARPDLTVSTSFAVTVIDYIEATTTTMLMNAGESNTIPIDLFTSVALQNLQLRLSLKREHLKNLSIESMVPQAIETAVDQSSPDVLSFNFTASEGAFLQGTQQLARLHFNTTSDQISAIVPLTIESLTYTRMETGPDPTVILNDGRVVILGNRPLLEARLNGGQRQLVLYGRVGSNYTIQSRLNLAPGNAWANRSTLTMTNSVRVVPAPSQTAPVIYFQLRQ